MHIRAPLRACFVVQGPRPGFAWNVASLASTESPSVVCSLPIDISDRAGWVGSAYVTAYGAESAEYLASWLDGARDVHNLTIDFVGLSQNEKPTCIPTDTGHQCGSTLSKRAVFDAHGHRHVQIVAPDAFIDNVEQLYGMLNHSSEVDIFGMHGEADLYETYGASVPADPWLTSGDHPLFISENEACYSGIRSLARCARCVNIYR